MSPYGPRIHRHDRDTSPINNHQRDLDIHNDSHAFIEYLIDLTSTFVTLFPLSRDILLARDPIIGIRYLVQSRSRQALFTRSVIQYPCDRTHRSRACKLRGCCVTEWARRISFRHADGQIPVLIHATQQVTFRDTCQTPL